MINLWIVTICHFLDKMLNFGIASLLSGEGRGAIFKHSGFTLKHLTCSLFSFSISDKKMEEFLKLPVNSDVMLFHLSECFFPLHDSVHIWPMQIS